MAKRISDLPADTVISGEETVPMDDAGTAKKATITSIFEKMVRRYSTIAALRLATGAAGESAQVKGYYAAGDGGGGPLRVWGTAGSYVDNGGSIIVPTGGDGSGAWVWEHSGDIDVRWFGAKGDGDTSDTAVIQAAIDAAIPLGRQVYIPTGFYVIDGDGIAVLNTDAGDTGGTQSVDYRTGLVGDGAGSSILKWEGGAEKACLTIGTGGSSRSRFDGFSCLQTEETKVGYGIYLYETAHVVFEGVAVLGFEYGMKAVDNFSVMLEQCVFQENIYGIDARKSTISDPNAWALSECNVLDNTTHGAVFANPAILKIDGGSFERNGSGVAGQGALKIDGNPEEGVMGLSLNGVYFEKNNGSFDVGVYDSNTPAMHAISDCTFNRTDVAIFTSTNIAFYKTTAAKTFIKIDGNGFAGFNTYVADAGRAYIQVPAPLDNNYIVKLGINIFGDATEKPDLSGALGQDSHVAAAVRFNGATAAIDGVSVNVESVTRNDVGDYTIAYSKALREAKNIYAVGGTPTSSFWQLFSESTTELRFKMYNASDVAADFTTISLIVYGADGML